MEDMRETGQQPTLLRQCQCYHDHVLNQPKGCHTQRGIVMLMQLHFSLTVILVIGRHRFWNSCNAMVLPSLERVIMNAIILLQPWMVEEGSVRCTVCEYLSVRCVTELTVSENAKQSTSILDVFNVIVIKKNEGLSGKWTHRTQNNKLLKVVVSSKLSCIVYSSLFITGHNSNC
jgi:hypothetical protein